MVWKLVSAVGNSTLAEWTRPFLYHLHDPPLNIHWNEDSPNLRGRKTAYWVPTWWFGSIHKCSTTMLLETYFMSKTFPYIKTWWIEPRIIRKKWRLKPCHHSGGLCASANGFETIPSHHHLWAGVKCHLSFGGSWKAEGPMQGWHYSIKPSKGHFRHEVPWKGIFKAISWGC